MENLLNAKWEVKIKCCRTWRGRNGSIWPVRMEKLTQKMGLENVKYLEKSNSEKQRSSFLAQLHLMKCPLMAHPPRWEPMPPSSSQKGAGRQELSAALKETVGEGGGWRGSMMGGLKRKHGGAPPGLFLGSRLLPLLQAGLADSLHARPGEKIIVKEVQLVRQVWGICFCRAAHYSTSFLFCLPALLWLLVPSYYWLGAFVPQLDALCPAVPQDGGESQISQAPPKENSWFLRLSHYTATASIQGRFSKATQIPNRHFIGLHVCLSCALISDPENKILASQMVWLLIL